MSTLVTTPGETYVYPRETWDSKQCERFSKSPGVFSPYKGEYSQDSTPYGQPGYLRHYNGGTTVDGVWYATTFKPLPEIDPDYVWVSKLSWGTYLRHRNDVGKYDTIIRVDDQGKRTN